MIFTHSIRGRAKKYNGLITSPKINPEAIKNIDGTVPIASIRHSAAKIYFIILIHFDHVHLAKLLHIRSGLFNKALPADITIPRHWLKYCPTLKTLSNHIAAPIPGIGSDGSVYGTLNGKSETGIQKWTPSLTQ